MDYQKVYEEWCVSATEVKVKEALEKMKTDEIRKQFAFSSNVAFGTAGMRAVMDAGTNCLNVYTIARATYGVCAYLKQTGGKLAVISYDSRNNSKIFANIAAVVFANNGISVKITQELQPTPVLSYCVRYFKADAGVMITASHNSKEYNGYKVYGADGAQIDVQTAEKITRIIDDTDPFSVDIKGLEHHFDTGTVSYIPSSVITDDYLGEVAKNVVGKIEKLKVVYTPLNGTGHLLVPEILTRCGLKSLSVVPEQSYPNGNFTTCSSPNPEKPAALKLGMRLLQQNQADILIATDPDCDRVGVAVMHNGKAVQLSGNEIGILLTEYLLSVRKANKTLPKNPIVVKTIVTSKLIDNILSSYKGESVSLLTGFKYIGDYVTMLTKKGEQNRFVLGFEESCGYLVGDYARDKDAVVASALICCMASYYKNRHRSLIDQLQVIYLKYGNCQNTQMIFRYEGLDGEIKRKQYMNKLHSVTIKRIAQLDVLSVIDLTCENSLGLPYADVIIYNLENDCQVIVRPSGTEPLIKFYMSCSYDDKNAHVLFESIEHCFNEFFTE